jgi:hypothetical protein
VLNNTGTGGLTVTGDSGSAVNATGGIILNSTGVGISLTNAANVSLDQMTVQGSQDDGINGSTVNNFSLTNSTVLNNGNGDNENGIQFTNLSGAATISNDLVRGSYEDNFNLLNTGGTLTSLNIKNTTFDHLAVQSAPQGGNGVLVVLQNAAVITDLSISGSTFRNNFNNAILVNTENTSRIGADNAVFGSTDGAVVSGNTFDDNNIAIQFGVFHSSDQTVDIQNNTIINDNRHANTAVGGTSTAIVVGSSAIAGAGSTLNARIEGNTIGNAAIDGSGSSVGSGIRSIVQGLTDGTILINNNIIRETPQGWGNRRPVPRPAGRPRHGADQRHHDHQQQHRPRQRPVLRRGRRLGVHEPARSDLGRRRQPGLDLERRRRAARARAGQRQHRSEHARGLQLGRPNRQRLDRRLRIWSPSGGEHLARGYRRGERQRPGRAAAGQRQQPQRLRQQPRSRAALRGDGAHAAARPDPAAADGHCTAAHGHGTGRHRQRRNPGGGGRAPRRSRCPIRCCCPIRLPRRPTPARSSSTTACSARPSSTCSSPRRSSAGPMPAPARRRSRRCARPPSPSTTSPAPSSA